ncbi:hypothetical protein [Rhizobium tumorigenes]|uniref:Uncharacterized protein n=1 Tax=Rhizobium tumorigenes TaxID=2041385 RepID=A0AAF1KJA3_9HYPH|nr:hypothetical protein [Rhizobium tumorigenes]WFR97461.1 hypothetical protein PR017_07515 [Rhizobium tumorigenes]
MSAAIADDPDTRDANVALTKAKARKLPLRRISISITTPHESLAASIRSIGKCRVKKPVRGAGAFLAADTEKPQLL